MQHLSLIDAISIINTQERFVVVSEQYKLSKMHLFLYQAPNLKTIFKLGPDMERNTTEKFLCHIQDFNRSFGLVQHKSTKFIQFANTNNYRIQPIFSVEWLRNVWNVYHILQIWSWWKRISSFLKIRGYFKVKISTLLIACDKLPKYSFPSLLHPKG